jgi:hypothetical protein
MKELGHKQEKIFLYYDSQSVFVYCKKSNISRTKCIDIQYYFVREIIEDGSMGFQKIYIKKNLID